MNSIFIIPCYNTENNNFITPLIVDIKKHHENPTIFVVDSDSPDKSYMDEAVRLGATVFDIANKHYHWGAYWYIYDRYENVFDYFYCLHDSIKVKGNLDELMNGSSLLKIHTYFHGSYAGGGDVAAEHLTKLTNIPLKPHNLCVAGCMFLAHKKVMEAIQSTGLDRVLPNCTHHTTNYVKDPVVTSALDGAFGLCLEHLGFNLKEIAINGDCHQNGVLWRDGGNNDHEVYIQKLYGRRP